MRKLVFILLCIYFNLISQKLPQGFTQLKDIVPDIVIDLRYGTSDNFMGKPVDGYISNTAVGTNELAKGLKMAQKKLNPFGLGIKIYDSYRPQKAVNHFIRWSKLKSDTINKNQYYPELKKNTLFDLGFIASKSGHSRGSTVDVTLIHLKGKNKGKLVDMGGHWDFFGELSNYNFYNLSETQKQNRRLLRKTLINSGFVPYEKEWWHFTLKDEPFPNTYFDFIP